MPITDRMVQHLTVSITKCHTVRGISNWDDTRRLWTERIGIAKANLTGILGVIAGKWRGAGGLAYGIIIKCIECECGVASTTKHQTPTSSHSRARCHSLVFITRTRKWSNTLEALLLVSEQRFVKMMIRH